MTSQKTAAKETKRFPTTWENGIQTFSFVFRTHTPLEKGIQFLIFVFRFPTTYWNKIGTSFFVFPLLRTTELQF